MLKFISRTFALIALLVLVVAISPTISYPFSKAETAKQPQSFEPQTVNRDTITIAIVAAKDNRAEKLAAYFAAKKSPFTPYAQNFVSVADKYDLDWTLLPAIANLESQLGIQIPANSFNAYGWNNGKFHFSSWENANEVVASGIRTRYAPTGEVTAARIGKRYAASPTWTIRVTRYQADISNFK